MPGDEQPDHNADVGWISRLELVAIVVTFLLGALAFAGTNSNSNTPRLNECERLLREYRQGLRLMPKDGAAEYEQIEGCIPLGMDNMHDR